MPALLAYPPRFQVSDANGLAVPNAQLFFYLAGTTTDLTVYQDDARTVPHAQPVLADAAGIVPDIYIPDQAWKVIIKAGGVTLTARDNLPGYASGVGTNLTATVTSTTVTVNSNTGDDVTIPAATASLSGVMTAADKTKLNGIGAGANVTSVFSRTGVVIATAGDYSAAQITNTPAGGIAATTVQAAIDELDTEKAAKAVVLTAGAGLTGGGDLSASRTFDVGAGTGISVAADSVGLDTASTRNTDHASVAITAGAGLTGGGDITASRTVNVGAGTGITVNADDVALDIASTRNTDHTGVSVVAGAGLTGGGDISASRTLNIGAGTGITVNADDIAITAGGVGTTQLADNGVTNAKIRDSAALSVIGNATNATADPADIAASADGQVLRRAGTALGFGTIATAGIADDAVTYAKIQNVSATDRLLGRSTAGAGDIEEIPCTAAGRALIDDADASAQRTTLGLVVGTNVQAQDSDLQALADNATNGLWARTGAGTGAARTISGTANEVAVANGDGVAGNPTLSLPSAITLTGKTLTGGTFSGPVTSGTLDVSQAVVFSGDISPAQITANQNDYSPTGLATASTLRLSTDASRTITGLAGGADGRLLLVRNTGGFDLVLSDQDAASAAANRFRFGANLTLPTLNAVLLQYDGTDSRWYRVADTLAGAGGGGGGAPTGASYVTLATDGTLTAERVFTPGTRLTATDGGAGGNYTLNAAFPPGFLFGAVLSNNATDANNDIDVSAGSARDDADNDNIVLASAITKRLDAAWAVGTNQGGLDTGSEAANTWYHVWLIKRSDTGVVDVLFSTSATAPTLPANYDRKRRIGAVRNNASSNLLAFSQHGDEFLWSTPIIDVDAANPGTSAVTRTLTVPTGVKVFAQIWAGGHNVVSNIGVYISSLDTSDVAVQAVATAALTAPLSAVSADGTGTHWDGCNHVVRTNTSAQVRSRLSASAAGDRLGIITYGWRDDRGRLAA